MKLELYGPWFRHPDGRMVDASEMPHCKHCRMMVIAREDDDEYGTGLCYDCFESSLEEHEERKRERIARQNEY